jgi:hypothetical protein
MKRDQLIKKINSIIILLLFGLCLLGCNNQSSKQDTLSNLEQQDTIEQITLTDNHELLFQRLSHETYVQANDFAKMYPDEYKMTNAILGLDMLTSSQDTLNLIIESWLDKYYTAKGISEKTNTIEEYYQRDSIINGFIIDVEQIDELQDILIYFHITSIYECYLSHHYLECLSQTIEEQELRNTLTKEIVAWRNFYDSQSETLRIFLSEIGSGVTRGSTFFSFKTSFYSRMKVSILDLYWALTNSTYAINSKFIPINEKYFEKEYRLMADIIQDTTQFSDRYYPFEERLQIVQQEKKAWFELMQRREIVSRQLSGNVKSVYENATYRLQKQHLIELKNEFDEYGCFGAEYGKLLLTDSCSYEKLLNSKHPSAILREKWE